ncbi:MAG: alpha/beta hydrolase [Pseudomonadota bacterium]
MSDETETVASTLFDAFFRPLSMPLSEGLSAYLATGRRSETTYRNNPLVYYSWGEGETVLLVHGINSRGASMKRFVDPIVASGRCAVFMDAPAHGESGEGATDIIQCGEAIAHVCERVGDVSSAICHSLGGMWFAYAQRHFRVADRAVTIGSPATIARIVHLYARMCQMKDDVKGRFIEKLLERYGDTYWVDYSIVDNSRGFDIPGLIIHDENDEIVPYEDAAEIEKAWPSTHGMTTSGLGHFGVLKDADVVDAACRFAIAGD